MEYNASPWVYVEHAICNGAIIDISNIDISNIDQRCISKLRRTSYSTAVMIGKTLHVHKSQSHIDTFTRTSFRVSKMNAVARAQLTFQMLALLQKY